MTPFSPTYNPAIPYGEWVPSVLDDDEKIRKSLEAEILWQWIEQDSADLPPEFETAAETGPAAGNLIEIKSEAQGMALESEADILLYGGAAGSLKSFTLLVDASIEVSNPNYNGIIFRQSFPELRDLVKKSLAMYPQLGGKFTKGSPMCWTFPSGATIWLGYMGADDDVFAHQGNEYCVEKGTPILMADGSYEPIESIKIGDEVQTLEGPRPVTATFHGMRKPCVEASVYGPDGAFLGVQVHPEDHPILGLSSWESYASLAGGRTSSSKFHDCTPAAPQLPVLCGLARLYELGPRSDSARSGQPTLSHDLGISVMPSCSTRKAASGSHSDRPQPSGPLQSPPDYIEALLASSRTAYARGDWGTVEGYPVHCSDDCGRCGGQLPDQSSSALTSAPSLGDAEAPSRPSACSEDASGNIPQCNRLLGGFEYVHPYTNRRRRASSASSVGAYSVTPVGIREVCDLTVADTNHYITCTGLVNRNCFIGFDEAGHQNEHRIRYMFTRLRTTDKSLKLRMRLTANPGGPGHAFLMKFFLKGICPHCEPSRAVVPGKLYTDAVWPSDKQPVQVTLPGGKVISPTVAFIPGKVTDHNLLGDAYIGNLMMQAASTAKMLLDGCWKQWEGQFFDCFTETRGIIRQADGSYTVPEPDMRMVVPLADLDVKYWYPHFVGGDYGFSISAAAAMLFVRLPATERFKNGRIAIIDEYVEKGVTARDYGQALIDRWFLENGQVPEKPRAIQMWAVSPDAFRKDGSVNDVDVPFSRIEQMNEALAPYGMSFCMANNDRPGGWMKGYQMLRDGELVIASHCRQTIEAFQTRIRDPKKFDDILKVSGDPLDDLIDGGRYGWMTWPMFSSKPKDERIEEATRGLDITNAYLTVRKMEIQERRETTQSYSPKAQRGGRRPW